MDDWLDAPMLVLAWLWLALAGSRNDLGESSAFEIFGTIIWSILSPILYWNSSWLRPRLFI